jgi:hypothetical protein
MMPPATEKKRPPRGLSAWARGVWVELHAEYEFSAPESLLLERGLRLFDRADECGAVVAREGLVVGKRPHPLLGVQRDSLQGALRFVRALGFETEGERRRPGRPSDVSWSAQRSAGARGAV